MRLTGYQFCVVFYVSVQQPASTQDSTAGSGVKVGSEVRSEDHWSVVTDRLYLARPTINKHPSLLPLSDFTGRS